jgi:CRISPR type III-A-associated protein Csm2
MDIKGAIQQAGIKPNPGTGYFEKDSAGKPHLRLEWVARDKVEPLAQQFGQDRLTTHQLRRFYNYCRKIEARLRTNQGDWGDERVNVAKLSAFAADAAGKRDAKIPESFRKFIDRNVDMVKTQDDFEKGFMEHFQALVGYSAMYLRDR